MNVDPAASMRCWAADIELGGRAYEIPALPAADWWPVLESQDLSKILDMIGPDETADLDELILAGAVTGEEMKTALTDTVEEMSGRSFHAAFVLVTVAGMAWPMVGGALAQRGFRWDVMPLGAALDAVHSLIVGGLEEKPRAEFLALLENETLTAGKPSTRQREKIAGEFETMAGPRPTGGARSTGAPSDSARPRTRRRPRPPRQDGPSAAPTPPPAPPG